MEPLIPHLLRLDASARHSGSHSRRLADVFCQQWQAAHPDGRLTTRDLNDIPHVTEAQISAMSTPENDRTGDERDALALSDVLTKELFDADTLLVATPMYNFAVPSCLKAWLDQVVWPGRTFVPGQGGLLSGRRAIVATARSGVYEPGASLDGWDFETPYLRKLLGYIGIDDVTPVHADLTTALDGTAGTDGPYTEARLEHAQGSWGRAIDSLTEAGNRP